MAETVRLRLSRGLGLGLRLRLKLTLTLSLSLLLLLRPGRSAASSTCELYLAPSTVKGAGRGVFAGRDYSPNDIVERGVSLTLDQRDTSGTILRNYMFGTDDPRYGLMILGAGSLINTMLENNSVIHEYSEELKVKPPQYETSGSGYTNHTSTQYRAVRDIAAGEEVFVSHGGERWFQEKLDEATNDGAQARSPDPLVHRRSLEDLQKNGVCLSDVYVKESTIVGAGQVKDRPPHCRTAYPSPLFLYNTPH